MSNRAHNHYFKDVKRLEYIDVYRVLQLFNVTDPCIQHAVKKLLVAGGRGAGKDISQDIKEAIDSLQRWQEMFSEDTTVIHIDPSAKDLCECGHVFASHYNKSPHRCMNSCRCLAFTYKEE